MNVKRNSVKTSFGVIYALCVFVCGCQTSTKSKSELEWGAHQQAYSANLLSLLPGQSVEFCAPTTDFLQYAESATKQWATVLGRWGHFNINPCGSGSNVVINMVRDDSAGVAMNYFTSNQGQIAFANWLTGPWLSAVILHELGHSWGLCDQYYGAGGCSDHSSPLLQNDEVMGASDPSKQFLTQGDMIGIREAEKLNRSYFYWQDYFSKLKSQSSPNPSQKPLNQIDSDQDGVTDDKDLCTDTPAGKKVNKTDAWAGCAEGEFRNRIREPDGKLSVDSDRDGVADAIDRCPSTPQGRAPHQNDQWSGCAAGEVPTR